MFESIYNYESLKRQTLQLDYINSLNVLSESCYDTISLENSINESMEIIEEASKKGRLNLIEKFKTNAATAKKILEKNEAAALKCKPIGLMYKDFIEFLSDKELKDRYKKALSYIHKFNPEKASEKELKDYIRDSSNNIQFKEISRIFGSGKERYGVNDVIIISKKNKEISKNDIKSAVDYLKKYDSELTRMQREFTEINAEYSNYVRSQNGLATGNIKGDLDKLRKNALNHQKSLISIVDSSYYQFSMAKMREEFKQAKHIVVKAAYYNPRNIKESTILQDHIDAMYDFYNL